MKLHIFMTALVFIIVNLVFWAASPGRHVEGLNALAGLFASIFVSIVYWKKCKHWLDN